MNSLTEWDAVFLDTANDELVFVETKHKVTSQHVRRTIKKADSLKSVLSKVNTEALKPHASKKFKTIIAGLIFEEKAATKAIKAGIKLCYVTHSRYAAPDGDVLQRDLKNRTFLLPA